MIEENWNALHRMTFVERQKEVQAGEQAIFEDNQRLVLLMGEPGIGKTEFVRHFGEKNRHRFPGGTFILSHPTNDDEHFELRQSLNDGTEKTLLIYDGLDEAPSKLEWVAGFLRGIETSLDNVHN